MDSTASETKEALVEKDLENRPLNTKEREGGKQKVVTLNFKRQGRKPADKNRELRHFS